MARKKGKGDEAAAEGADPKEAKGAKDGEKGKRRGGVVPAIIVAIAVLAGGAMAGGVFGGGGDAAEAAPTPTPTPTAMELGLVTDLEAVTLNLAGEGNHFLKLKVAVETAPDVVEPPALAPIYDVIIDRFADYAYTDLLDLSVRERTKVELLDALGEIYGDDIVRVYYTEFVMQ